MMTFSMTSTLFKVTAFLTSYISETVRCMDKVTIEH